MARINEQTADAWTKIAANVEPERPSVGKRVRITKGKRVNVEGVVAEHKRSRFSTAYRYGNDAHMHMLDMRGRRGWTVRLRTDSGENFWADADSTYVLRWDGDNWV